MNSKSSKKTSAYHVLKTTLLSCCGFSSARRLKRHRKLYMETLYSLQMDLQFDTHEDHFCNSNSQLCNSTVDDFDEDDDEDGCKSANSTFPSPQLVSNVSYTQHTQPYILPQHQSQQQQLYHHSVATMLPPPNNWHQPYQTHPPYPNLHTAPSVSLFLPPPHHQPSPPLQLQSPLVPPPVAASPHSSAHPNPPPPNHGFLPPSPFHTFVNPIHSHEPMQAFQNEQPHNFSYSQPPLPILQNHLPHPQHLLPLPASAPMSTPILAQSTQFHHAHSPDHAAQMETQPNVSENSNFNRTVYTQSYPMLMQYQSSAQMPYPHQISMNNEVPMHVTSNESNVNAPGHSHFHRFHYVHRSFPIQTPNPLLPHDFPSNSHLATSSGDDDYHTYGRNNTLTSSLSALEEPTSRRRPQLEEQRDGDEIRLPSFEATPEMRNEACAICLCMLGESPVSASSRCGHIMHTECVTQWLRRNRDRACPICRLPYTLTETGTNLINSSVGDDNDDRPDNDNRLGIRDGNTISNPIVNVSGETEIETYPHNVHLDSDSETDLEVESQTQSERDVESNFHGL